MTGLLKKMNNRDNWVSHCIRCGGSGSIEAPLNVPGRDYEPLTDYELEPCPECQAEPLKRPKSNTITLKICTMLTILAYTSCGGPDKVLAVDPAFEPYLNQFKTQLIRYRADSIFIDDLVMGFSYSGITNGIGMCAAGPGVSSHPTITIDHDYWVSSSELEKTGIVFHELGHCVLFRQHTSDKINVSVVLANKEYSLIFPFIEEPKSNLGTGTISVPMSMMYPNTSFVSAMQPYDNTAPLTIDGKSMADYYYQELISNRVQTSSERVRLSYFVN